jgi:AcrR family transcriptional regulator
MSDIPGLTSRKARIRRPKEESRALILCAAEALLREQGVSAINVRAVAAKVGLTDAAINHHFGTRDDLLAALLRHGGRKLKLRLSEALTSCAGDGRSIDWLIGQLAQVYIDERYAELALQLHMAGWRDEGKGFLDPVVDIVHARRLGADGGGGLAVISIDDTRFLIGQLHMAIAFEPVFGSAFRRSVGLDDSADREAFVQRLDRLARKFLDLPDPRAPH